MKDLRITHYPQENSKPFIVEVDTLKEAKIVIDTLAGYDWFLYTNKIETKYPNSVNLEILNEENEYVEWYDQNTGNNNLNDFFERIEQDKFNRFF